MSNLSNRVIWIVGASGAIGGAIAKRVAEAGALAVLSGRSPSKLEVVSQAIHQAGGEAECFPIDIRDRKNVDEVAAQIIARHGRIDGLVNTTSISDFGPFMDLDDDAWMNVLNTKLIGYVRTMRAVLPTMTDQKRGVIVNLSGRGGKQPTVTHLPGGCANAAVNLLGKGISDAFIGHGVRVNTLVPGPIESERLNEVMQTSAEMSARSLQTYAKPGKPDDVARVVAWLLSDDSSHVLGAMIPVDGGSTYTI